jgi:hypothetical protein
MSNCLPETPEGFSGFGFAEAEGGEQADGVFAGYSGEYMLFKKQAAADFLDRFFKLYTYH